MGKASFVLKAQAQQLWSAVLQISFKTTWSLPV